MDQAALILDEEPTIAEPTQSLGVEQRHMRLVFPKKPPPEKREEYKKQFPDRVVASEELTKLIASNPECIDLDTATRIADLAGSLYRCAATPEDFMRAAKTARFVLPYISNAVRQDDYIKELAAKRGKMAYDQTLEAAKDLNSAMGYVKSGSFNLTRAESSCGSRDPFFLAEQVRSFAEHQHFKDTECWYKEEILKLLLCCVDPIGRANDKKALELSMFVAKEAEEAYFSLGRHANPVVPEAEKNEGQRTHSELYIHKKVAMAQVNRYAARHAKNEHEGSPVSRLTRAAMANAFVVQRSSSNGTTKHDGRRLWSKHMDALGKLIGHGPLMKMAKYTLKHFTVPHHPHQTPASSFELHIWDKYPELAKRPEHKQEQPTEPVAKAALGQPAPQPVALSL